MTADHLTAAAAGIRVLDRFDRHDFAAVTQAATDPPSTSTGPPSNAASGTGCPRPTGPT
ncbi:hypothetical protein ABT288_03125 [Streptomyces sp. NPDC001093]|uniref:hypothetical protein n=1 Tax=Streptomyces sp. NPDC001093 TaxID=3154376 RepID=UPI0033215920